MYSMMFKAFIIIQLIKMISSLQYLSENIFPDIPKFSQSLLNDLCKLNTASTCSCDPSCFKYGTCCIDYLWDANLNENIELYKARYLNAVKPVKYLSCQPLLKLSESKKTFSEWLYMVAECPKETNKKLADLCTNQNKLRFPVIGSNKIVYKNQYCAQCNSVNTYEQLNVTADCIGNKNDTSHITEKYNNCKFKLLNNDIIQFVNYCKENVYDNCTNNSISCRWCNSYVALISYENKCYKNIHCLIEVLQRTPSRFDLCPFITDEFEQQLADHFPYGSNIIPLPRYSVLVSFALSDTEIYNTKKCSKDKAYDVTTNTCVDLVQCIFGFHLEGNTCVPTVDSRAETEWINTSKKILSIEEIKNQCTKNLILDDKTNKEQKIENKYLISNTFNNSHERLFNKSKNISQKKQKNIFTTELYGEDQSRVFPNRLCAEPIISDKESFNISGNCTLYFNASEYSPNNYIVLYARKKSPLYRVVTCKRFHLSKSCNMRRILNYTYFKNKSIFDHETRKVYAAEEYAPLDTGIGVCIQYYSKLLNWIYTAQRVEGYITIVGCSLSILGYIVTMTTYVIIPELNTVPGKSIVCLCFMLLICDMITLSAQSFDQKWCKVSSYLIHFFSLSAQMWCTVLAYDIWLTFSGKNIMRDTNKRRLFYFYCAFSWCNPLILLIIIVLLEKTNILNLGYGANGTCWINSQMGRIVAYIIPVILSTTYATTTLFYTLLRIFKQQKKSGKLLKKSGGEDVSFVKMAVKLILLVGSIEMVGFLQTNSSSETGRAFNTIFKLLFSIFRSFRGVFIFWLYVVTDRVLTIYRDIKRTKSFSSSKRSNIQSILKRKEAFSETSTV
ncbi:uncharacterized protein LOC105845893 isoform X1 [Hydra vulgaris]|uniref:uncharacterized protein LOC105845893 isoform X1 n=1 Tax=Hydra vulgaris TaxID=6087 RepID=UPI001F5EB07D|nr:uncharacterized protein LOC105845893 [Hydra vulgaris]